MKRGKDYIGVGTGAVIINQNNEILMLLRNKEPEIGCWSIPGGAVEFLETLEDAIIREVKEEVGVTVGIIALLGATNHILHEEGIHWVTMPFFVTILKGEPINLEPQKHADMRWFPIQHLPKNVTTITHKTLEDFFKWKSLSV